MKPGDRIMYNHKFLHSIMGGPDLAKRRGTITKVEKLRAGLLYVKVKWDGEQDVQGVLSANICRDGCDPTE
jgi:hypothetical protein